MRINASCIMIWLLLICGSASAQQSRHTFTRTFAARDSILLDTLSVAPGSVIVLQGKQLLREDLHYHVDYARAILFLMLKTKDSLVITYRTMGIQLSREYRHKDQALIAHDVMTSRNPFSFGPDERTNIFSNTDGLLLSGSLSRGVSFGNSQDLTVNSYLNLQVSGKLNNEIDVLAAISDDNNPIQPEGNTQQLQDFDKVFIQLSKDSTKLVLGDFPMERPAGSYFMHYNKKSRGAQAQTALRLSPQTAMRITAEGAVARGRFARNIINGSEGNLGPYRLSGVNGEQYIIIVSGTEAVYLDGKKLTRGEQNDYVIDYNSGEIVFMPRILITAYSRIVAEFQYSDRNFARSVFHVGDIVENKKYTLRFNYYSEQDNKNQPFQQDLTNEDKETLKNAGDQLSLAYTSGAKRISTFSNSLILYRRLDTLSYSGIYLYTTDPASDSVFYQVTFSFVGANKGNYVQAASSANGRVYKWVEPLNGIPQGSFEPLLPLISPRRMQMFNAGGDFALSPNTHVGMEVAGSNYDKNTYADKDKFNDQGWAVQLKFDNKAVLNKTKPDGWYVKSEGNYEYVDRYFRYVERYRPVEFNRTWNRQLQNQQENDTSFEEHIARLKTGIYKPGLLSVNYQLAYYNRVISFSGIQHTSNATLTWKRHVLNSEAELLNTTSRVKDPENAFSRYFGDYAYKMKYVTSGVKYSHEQSTFRDSTKFLQAASYAFNQYQLYFDNPDSLRIRYHLDFTQRLDYLAKSNELSGSTDARQANMKTEWNRKNGTRLLVNITYREFKIKDTALVKTKPENSLLTRIEYDYNFLKKVFTASTYYQIGSGQELVRDYQFVETRPGQGVYAWYDFNSNGVQENNEFVIAPFPNQANFIKVFLPTNTFIRTNTNQFNQTLNINPSDVWGGKKGLRKAISNFSDMAAIRVDRKVRNNNSPDFLNPFAQNPNDSQLISVASDMRNTFFYKRFDPSFGMEYTWQQNRSKTLLTNGFDSRGKLEHSISVRWNINSSISINISALNGNKNYNSQFYSSNNYRYLYYNAKPKLTYQITRNLRSSVLFSYYEADNAVELGNEKAVNKETGADLRYNILEKGVISAKFSNIMVNFKGSVNTPVGFDMLQGLQNGRNMLWNLNYQQRINNNIQINLNYDGRRSEGSKAVHTGRAEARYIF